MRDKQVEQTPLVRYPEDPTIQVVGQRDVMIWRESLLLLERTEKQIKVVSFDNTCK